MEKDIEIFNTLRLQNESEVVEFKEAKENFDIDDLGKYFSALSNEANLRQHRFAWIVFGVHDKTKALVGTNFKNGEKALHKLKNDMAQHITGGLIFRDIIEVKVEEDDKVYRILMFKVPASPHNIVTCWKGIAYGRKGESLKPLDQAKQDEIRNQPPLPDWSEQIAQATNQEADYSRNKGIDEDKCRTLLLSAIDDHIILPRKKIDELLYDLLPKGLTDEQKRNKVDYLLKKLSKSNIIAIDKEKGGWKRVAEK